MNDLTNDQHIKRQTTDALLKAGIGYRYHDKSLDSIPTGVPIKAMFLDGGLFRRIETGDGLTMISVSPEGGDVFRLTAKGLMLAAQVGCMVTNPMKILDAIDDNYTDFVERVKTVKCLFVANFVEDGDTPFTRNQTYRIERLLMERHEQRRANFLDVEAGCALTNWWGRRFSQEMATVNLEVEV